MHAGIHLKCLNCYLVLTKINVYLQMLVKISNVKFNNNPPGVSLTVPYGQTGKQI